MTEFTPPSQIMQLKPGGRLGKYVILSELGRGGMAIVYKAHQPDLDRIVAIKVLFGAVLQQRFIERFQGEARAVAKMNHPNVIRIYEVGEQEGLHYLVMEHIEGQDLLAFLHDKKPSFDEVVDIVIQVSEALAYCHGQRIIHRDLKPTNVLMRGNTPILIDFGLAKAVDDEINSGITLHGEVVGSPAYMSPEQASGNPVGPLTDICSLGIIMYELVSFKNPFLDPRSLHQTALNAIKAEPVPLRYLSPWLSSDFEAIVSTCMAKDQNARYRDIQLVLQDLLAFKHGQPVMAKPPGPLALAWRFLKASPILIWGLLFLILLGGLIGGFLLLQAENRKTPWGVVLTDGFEGGDSSLVFVSTDRRADGQWIPSQSFRTQDGALVADCPSECAASVEQEWFGDLRVEFKVRGLDGDNHDLNAFMFGETPDKAIRFGLGEYGGHGAVIRKGLGDRFPFGSSPVRLNGGIDYKVAIERDGERLSLSLDGKIVSERWQSLPDRIDRRSRLGFHTWKGRISIDSLRVLKKAVALSASPTVVADAYFEEGFFRNAIPAYRHIIGTYRSKNIRYEAHLKLGKCFLALKDDRQALYHLGEALSGSKDPDLLAEAIFLLGTTQQRAGDYRGGFERLKLLPETYPESPYNQILADSRLETIHSCLDTAGPDPKCLNMLMEETRFLIQHLDAQRNRFGPRHIELLEIFRKHGHTIAPEIIEGLEGYYQNEPRTAVMMKLFKAKVLMGSMKLAEANTLLNSIGQGIVDSEFVPERDVLKMQAAYLHQGLSAATPLAHSLLGEHSDYPGMAFRAFLWAKAFESLGAIAAPELDAHFFINGNVSHRERISVGYLSGKIDVHALENSFPPPQALPLEFEEQLVPWVAARIFGGSTTARKLLTDLEAKTPIKTLEFNLIHALGSQGEGPTP